MRDLAKAIAKEVHNTVSLQLKNLQFEQGELRVVFNGPPQPFLSEVYESLIEFGGIRGSLAGGQEVLVPVLLLQDSVQAGSFNPPIGLSGVCDHNHVLDLRNSPQCPRYIVLSAPGSLSNLSLDTTWTYCGLAPQNQVSSASISAWWHDDFIDAIVGKSLERFQSIEPDWLEKGKSLVQDSVASADSIEKSDGQRLGAWRVLSRIWSISENEPNPPKALSLACGYPCPSGSLLPASEQVKALRQLADLLEDGFKLTIDQFRDAAEDDEERLALDEFLFQLQLRCPIQTAVTLGMSYYYCPFVGDATGDAPSWWSILTLERWQNFLEEASSSPEALEIRCVNSIAPLQSGIVPVVASEVELEIRVPRLEGEDPTSIQIIRDSGSAASRRIWDLAVDGTARWIDDTPPQHKRPLKYTVTSAKMKSASAHVISIASWSPGILVCGRDSRKVTPPKPPRSSVSGISLESFLTLRSQGRQYLSVYISPEVTLHGNAHGADHNTMVGSDDDEAAIAQISDLEYGVEVKAGSDKTYDISFRKQGYNKPLTLRIYLTCDDIQAEQCNSEFERLILLNRGKRDRQISSTVHVNTNVRSSDLQGWMLEKDTSYYPLVFGPDYSDHWRLRNWESQEGTIISKGRFLSDPRPTLSEMDPPAAFKSARREIAKLISEQEHGLIEGAPLGVWLTKDSLFEEKVEVYLRAYCEWLDQAPEIASWCDVSIVTGFEGDQKTLVIEPDALLLSPLHPVRLAWQAAAQRTLLLSYRKKPCPAASILDPRCVPDSLTLPIRTASGEIRERVFFSVECSSDYWSVLWNSARANRIGETLARTPFDAEFGIQIGGLANSFSTSQVSRSLNDISSLLSAKAILNVSITSAASQNNATNEGLVEWCRAQFSKQSDGVNHIGSVGKRFVRVLDQRPEDHRPEEAEISNLAEDTENSVSWYATKELSTHSPDLTIVALLETSSMSAEKSPLVSPISHGGLFRTRVRQQLRAGAGAFLSESRVAIQPSASGDSLLDRTATALARLENLGDIRHSYVFAPSVHALQESLSHSRYVAVSSSAIDPACFLGGWLDDTYLWDYDLPSYSSRAGDTNGYYLLAKIRDLDRDTLRNVVRRLPNCDDLTQDAIDNLILEVARRGIPTVRGLSSGDSGAVGDLGLFVAARLLQDDFRINGSRPSMFPVWREEDGRSTINLLIPVDPFQNYLDDLAKAVGKQRHRPDLLLICLHIENGSVSGKITPIEVKYRSSADPMPIGDCSLALSQAKSFAELLSQIADISRQSEMLMWKLAHAHLHLAFIEYGFRVYSQQTSVIHRGAEWAERQATVTKAIIAGETYFECDPRGRLIVIDGSPSSSPRDVDQDGFFETISLARTDAGTIVAGDPDPIYSAVIAKLGTWEIEPEAIQRERELETSRSQAEGALASTQVQEVSTAVSVDLAGAMGLGDNSGGSSEDGASRVAGDEQELSFADTNETDGVRLLIGQSLDTFRQEPRSLCLSDTNLNQLNIGVVGDLGTGKTQLLKSLVYQITTQTAANKGVQPNILILDYKRDYSSREFVEATNARVIRPKNLNLNLFDLSQAPDSTTPWLDRFSFFADILDKIYSGIGPVQRQTLRSAVRSVYNDRAGSGVAPTIYDIHTAYRQITNAKPDSVSSIIEEMVDRELFLADASSTSTRDFLSGVVVISLDALGQDDRAKNMLVAILLNLFYENMLRISKRPFYGTDPQKRVIDSFLLVDEADNIMQYEFDVLRKILLQGREFGVGVILASQYLRHFKVGATDYREPLLTWLIHKVPNVLAQELSALGMAANQGQIAERIKTLGLHECLYKTFNVSGEFLKGMPFYRLVVR